jgi:hypothetical protein
MVKAFIVIFFPFGASSGPHVAIQLWRACGLGRHDNPFHGRFQRMLIGQGRNVSREKRAILTGAG